MDEHPGPPRVAEFPPHPGGAALPAPPGVWPWFVVYCVVTALLCLCGSGLGMMFLVVDPHEFEMESMEARIIGVVYLGVSILLFVPYMLAPFLPKRRWVWVYDLVLICLGMTSCCTLPACIALLIFWIKPNTRQFFGWT